MKWYLANLVMQCVVGDNQPGPWTVDEQVRLILAQSPEQAYDKAIELGRQQEAGYRNQGGQSVHWVFAGLAELVESPAETFEDGAQISWVLHRNADPARLTRPRECLRAFAAQREDPIPSGPALVAQAAANQPPGEAHLFCHCCGEILTPGQGDFYVVRIEAFADPTPPRIELSESPEDIAQEIDSLIQKMQNMSEQELMDQVYRRMTIHLCRGCYRPWIENPAGDAQPPRKRS